jgi:TonB family protein
VTRHGYARVTYDAEGRVSHLAVDQKQLPPSCQPVLAALARTGLADFTSDIGSGDQQWHVLPLSRRFAACTARPPAPSYRVGEEYDGQKISVPRKVRDVRPVYPPEMRTQGVQGMTIIEAVIADTGCVRALEVIRSSGAHLLDLAALEAVGQWEFEPTRLDGRPVPARMTVTMSFSLRR